MLKRLLCAAAAMLVLTGPMVRAEETRGEIACWLQFGEEPVRDGGLELIRAGDPVPEGFRLGEEFGGGIIAGEDIPSAAFAQWMSQKAGPGLEQEPDRLGRVRFRDLEPGIYLIRQGRESRDYCDIEPYLACVSPELSTVDTYPAVLPKSTIPRTAEAPEIYAATLGIALTLTGLFICLDREKRTPREY